MSSNKRPNNNSPSLSPRSSVGEPVRKVGFENRLSDDGAYSFEDDEGGEKALPANTPTSIDKGKKAIAIIKIQSIARKLLSIIRVRKRSSKIWERVFDPRFRMYFWFNKINGKSQWTVPRLLRLHDEKDHAAAIQFQRITRGFLGRMRAKRIVRNMYYCLCDT